MSKKQLFLWDVFCSAKYTNSLSDEELSEKPFNFYSNTTVELKLLTQPTVVGNGPSITQSQ